MSIPKGPRVAVCHPRMGQGGSEVTAMHVIQALAPDHEVDLLTTGRADLDALNEWCGTSVDRNAVRVRSTNLPFPFSRISGGDALRGAVHTRHCRALAPEYDVMISAYNLCDFGVPGIHLLADFSWDEQVRRRLDATVSTGMRSAFRRDGLLKTCYQGLVGRIAPSSGRDLFGGADHIVSNSRWSAALLQARFGIETDVLYPPVPVVISAVPWEARRERFVTIGRVAPEKRIETMVEILAGVRQHGHDLELHVAGDWRGDAYGRTLRARLESEAPWVVFAGPLAGEEKGAFLGGSRYGIHARSSEPFGIAVAEMALAGCLVFTPAEGGQAEIVQDPTLRYASVEEGVNKILALLGSERRLSAARARLASGLGRFSTVAFSARARDLTSKFLFGRSVAKENAATGVKGG